MPWISMPGLVCLDQYAWPAELAGPAEYTRISTPGLERWVDKYRQFVYRIFCLIWFSFCYCCSWITLPIQHVRHRIAIIIALAFSLSLTPIIFTWLASIHIWRFLLHKFIHLYHPKLEIVKTRSLRSALDTRRWPGLAVAVLLLNEDDDTNLSELRAKILQIMQSQIKKYLVLRRRLCVYLGCYLWYEDDTTLNANGQLFIWPNKAKNDAQLQEFIGIICSKPLPQDRPPWQVVLIPYSRSWAVLLCSHHLVVDSLPSLVDILSPTSCNLWIKNTPPLLRGRWATDTIATTLASTAFDMWTEPDGEIHVNTDAKTMKISKSSLFTKLRVIFSPLTVPGLLFHKIRALFQQIRLLAGDNIDGRSYFKEAIIEICEAIKLVLIAPYVFATQLASPVENVPLLRASVSPGNRTLAWTKPVEKELVERIAEAGQVTDVEVLLAACTGALRNFLFVSGASIPTSVSAILPVIVGERNTAAFALVDLPTGEWDPVRRLRLIGQQMAAVQKRPLHILIGAIVLRYASWILPQTVLTLALNFLSRRHTITVCFVDTPNEVMPHHSRLFYWRPPQGNAGLTFTLQSDDDCVSLAVASNQSVLAKPPLLTSQFFREIHAIAMALNVNIES
uniref:long-chain-alcohol O-fatty-acyltransferase n=1 Tax=Strigamia maritima TaxID=126957 RepID=T1JFL6_STRMM